MRETRRTAYLRGRRAARVFLKETDSTDRTNRLVSASRSARRDEQSVQVGAVSVVRNDAQIGLASQVDRARSTPEAAHKTLIQLIHRIPEIPSKSCVIDAARRPSGGNLRSKICDQRNSSKYNYLRPDREIALHIPEGYISGSEKALDFGQDRGR